MGTPEQLDLLAGSEPPAWVAQLRAEVRAWQAHGVFFGTSSWKYAGWLGQIYRRERYLVRGRFAAAKFDRECLAEYAATFPTVCGDFAFYQFYAAPYWDRLFAAVPADFRFGLKVPEAITCPVFPRHERYGAKAGLTNPDFLNAALCADRFLAPLAAHRTRVGYLVFEFPQFHQASPGHDDAFLDHLDQFLDRLPAGFPYGVELRTPRLLGAEYLDCLRRHQVAHVFNSWTHMPSIGEQLAQTGVFTAGQAIGRVLLRPGRTYEDAVNRFAPYDRIQEPYPEGYRDVARLVRAAKQADSARVVYLGVNNRFVGNAIQAIVEILRELGPPGA